MTKSDLQWEFLQCQALLIQYARLQGYKLTEGRGYASEAANAADGGHKRSTHLHRLAKDFNLFVEGKLIRGDHPAWQGLGQYWCALHPLARWGGDWDGDGDTEPGEDDFNHVSFEWQGIK